MKSFFQSLAYKNFFKFIFAGAFYTGIFSSLAVGIGLTVEKNYQDMIIALMIVFFIGALYGFVLCAIGFLMNKLLLANEKIRKKQNYVFIMNGFILSLVALVFFYYGKKLELTWWFLVFPGIPFIACIYLFSDYSKKWITPLVIND